MAITLLILRQPLLFSMIFDRLEVGWRTSLFLCIVLMLSHRVISAPVALTDVRQNSKIFWFHFKTIISKHKIIICDDTVPIRPRALFGLLASWPCTCLFVNHRIKLHIIDSYIQDTHIRIGCPLVVGPPGFRSQYYSIAIASNVSMTRTNPNPPGILIRS